jgi:hypothetical protein
VHCKLGKDEYWKCDQESNVSFDVVQKWDLDGPTEGVTFRNRQQQQRQPRDQREDQCLAVHQFQTFARQVPAPAELEQRAAKDQ